MLNSQFYDKKQDYSLKKKISYKKIQKTMKINKKIL